MNATSSSGCKFSLTCQIKLVECLKYNRNAFNSNNDLILYLLHKQPLRTLRYVFHENISSSR
jgi:hypothetical protein